jgi:hypothetical protein
MLDPDFRDVRTRDDVPTRPRSGAIGLYTDLCPIELDGNPYLRVVSPLYQDDLTPKARRNHFLVSGSARTTPTASPGVPYRFVFVRGSLEPAIENGTPETDHYSVKPSKCSKKCGEGDMSVTLAPSSPAAVHTSSALPATV